MSLVLSLQKLRQCVAGASAMFGRDVVIFPARNVEETSLGKNNVGPWECWGEENCGGEWFGESAAQGGDSLVRGLLVVVIRTMWNCNSVSVSMRTEEACSLIESFACRTRIEEVISNADHENVTDLMMERYVTDLCCHGNDVTVSCSSATLKYANTRRERQRAAMKKEALVDAAGLQHKFRSLFILMLSRVGQDRLYGPKSYSATFKEQVFNSQSLRLVEDYSATSSQPEVLQHRQPYLYRGLNDTSFQSLMVLSLIGWRSIWTLWHYCLLQLICCSF